MLSDNELGRIRSRFPVFKKKIYLNSCSQGALSDAVEDGLRDYLASWHEHGSPWDLWVEEYEAARRQFARFVGATAEEVAILPSASAAINAVASALRFNTRSKVVLGEFEFPTMGHVWLAQQERGARIEFVRARGNQMPADCYEQAIDEKTLIVPVTRVSFLNGFRSPLPEVVEVAHARGALVMLDDYQDCGTRPVDVRASDVDFYVAGTLKYLLGTPGSAYLYVKKSLLDLLAPSISGWFAQADPFAFDVKRFEPALTARKFEAGTPPIPNLYASMRGIALLQEIGLDQIAEQIARLARALFQEAHDLGIALKTEPDGIGPLVVFDCSNARALVERMASCGIVCSSRHNGLRISLHVYNLLSDVEAALDVIKQNLDLVMRRPLVGVTPHPSP
jgi:selenocysteine lyase/cysteine desulfurase